MAIEKTPRKAVRATYLPHRGTLVLDNAEGTVLEVERGCLWVTLERDPRDVILVGGMRFEIDRTGRTVVVAEADTTMRVYNTPGVFARVGAWVNRTLLPAYVRWAERNARRPLYFF